MRIIILATEPSGDFLGAKLIKNLKKKKKVVISGVGGEQMKGTGFQSWVQINEFNAIGIFEVLIRILKFVKLFKFIQRKILDFNPDILITIDSPSFSYRIVKRLQFLRNKTKFIHYVAPTVWAWKSYRARIFSELYDQMFTLFDFEPKYFRKFGLQTDFVGHQIFFDKKVIKKKKKYISFFPGSRTIEIKNNMKKLQDIIVKSEKIFSEFDIFILTLTDQAKNIKEIIKSKKIKIISDNKKKHQIMRQTCLAVAASGSVTLELIKYKVPTLVFYETHWLTKSILKLFVKVKYASLINIVYNKEIIPEFLFSKFNAQNIICAMKDFIKNKDLRSNQISYFNNFQKKMLFKNKNPSALIINKLKI